MKKLLKLGAAFAALTLLFAACKTEPDEPDRKVTPPSVTGIALHMTTVGGQGDYIQKQDVKPDGSFRVFWAVVQGNKGSDNKDYDHTYTLTITDNDGVVEEEEEYNYVPRLGGKKVTFVEDLTLTDKSITVTATANGNEEKSVSWVISVDANNTIITDPVFTNAQWVIKNTVLDRGRAIDAKTTTALTATGRKYEVFNNEPGASIDSQSVLGGHCFRDVTIMYLNVPIYVDANDFKKFGIQARIKIAGQRDTPLFGMGSGESWGSGRQGLVMGYINDPTAPDFGQTFASSAVEAPTTTPDNAPFFHGFRILSSGQHRLYGRRPGTGGYGSAQLSPTSGDTNLDIPGTTKKYQAELERADYKDGSLDYDTVKIEGFRDQEYVVKVVRSGGAMHYVEVYDSTGDTMLFSCHPSGGSNYPGTEMTNISNYLAFLVYGVKAEISDVQVFYDDVANPVWTDTAVQGATPETVVTKRVDITVNNGVIQKIYGDKENDYSMAGAPVGGVPLTAAVVPQTLAYAWRQVHGNTEDIVEWSVSGDGPLTYDEGAVWRTNPATGWGKNTFTATPKTGGSVTSSVKFFLMDPSTVSSPQSITIDTPAKDTLLFGHNADKIELTATILPVEAAPGGLTWAIASGGDVATIEDVDGVGVVRVKTGATVAAGGSTFTVTATALDIIGSPPVNKTSTPLSITVRDDGTRVWTFGKELTGVFGEATTNSTNSGSGSTTAGTAWIDSSSDNKNMTALTVNGGLRLTPSGNGSRWNSQQLGLANLAVAPATYLYMGYYNPASNGDWGTVTYDGTYKISVIASNTGDSVADTRFLYIQFAGEAAPVANIWPAGASNGSTGLEETAGRPAGAPTGVAYYTYSRIGTGAAKFGSSTGAFRVWAVMVEPAEALPPLTGLAIDKTNPLTVVKKQTIPAPAVVKTPSNSGDPITWSSDNTAVATVNAATGAITGVKGGTANITVQKTGDAGIKDTVSVTVTEKPLTALSITPATAVTLEKGQVILGTTFTVNKTPADTTDDIEWVSSAPTIASVANNGNITGDAVGSANVYVRRVGDDTMKSNEIAVTVTAATGPDPTVATWTFAAAPGTLSSGTSWDTGGNNGNKVDGTYSVNNGFTLTLIGSAFSSSVTAGDGLRHRNTSSEKWVQLSAAGDFIKIEGNIKAGFKLLIPYTNNGSGEATNKTIEISGTSGGTTTLITSVTGLTMKASGSANVQEYTYINAGTTDYTAIIIGATGGGWRCWEGLTIEVVIP